MESWIQRLFLAAAVLTGAPTLADETSSSVLDKIITPDMERREIREADLDTEDWEVGLYYGLMSVEDFGTNDVAGLRLAYHISEDFFMEANYGQTTTEETSFEDLSGGTQLLTDEQRDLSYYNLSVGYNLFPGEIFIGEGWSINSAFYVVAGVGNTNFADEEHFTYNLGAGLRLLPLDWVAVHLDFRSHVFDHDLLGKSETTVNLEAQVGLTLYF